MSTKARCITIISAMTKRLPTVNPPLARERSGELRRATKLTPSRTAAGVGAGARRSYWTRAARRRGARGAGRRVHASTMVINPDLSPEGCGDSRVQGDRNRRDLGRTDAILKQYPGADVYNGRGKASCRDSSTVTRTWARRRERGSNEDFGFPNSAKLAVQPGSLLQGEKRPDGHHRRAGSDPYRHHDDGGFSSGIGRTRARCRRPACGGCSPKACATARTCRARCRPRGWRRARRRASPRSCATRACSASTTCSASGTAPNGDASACSRPRRWRKPRRPN